MFQVGDKVVYGMHGVCVIAGTECRRVDKKNMEYLVLEPVGQDGARFLVPAQNAAVLGKLHPVPSQSIPVRRGAEVPFVR